MKKMMFSVLCVVCALTATAQEVTKRVKVPGFSGISAESVFDITLVRANKCAVEIFCPKEIEEALDVKVSGGDLVLRLNTEESGPSSAYPLWNGSNFPEPRGCRRHRFSKAPILSWGLAAHRRRPG